MWYNCVLVVFNFLIFFQLLQSMSRANASGKGRVISLLEGGYDTKQNSLGLAKAANSHVKALRSHPRIDS